MVMNVSQMASIEADELAGKYLTFALSNERYGFSILKVQEIIKVPHITTVPKCLNYIKGVVNLRGKIIPVIDLRIKFNMASAPYDNKTCIIVTNVMLADQPLLVGLVVDTVLDVINFMPSELTASPTYGDNLQSQFFIAMGTRDSILNILIDIDRVVAHQNSGDLAIIAAH
jgi:purine-binding chemotaxis protein CheW